MRDIVVCLAEALLRQAGTLEGSTKYLEPIRIERSLDIRTNNSRDLRNIIVRYLSEGDYCVIFDHMDKITPKIDAYLYALRQHACVITASRESWVIGDHTFSGSLAYDLWLWPKLKLGNLGRKDAQRLMENLSDGMNMMQHARGGFFRDVFHITQGNPGMIRRVLEKARQPKYIVDGKLNLNLIVIDCAIDEVHMP